MPDIAYLISPFSIITNSIIFIFVVLSIKSALANRLPICDGKYQTEGTITYSEYGTFAKDINLIPESLITYKYQVNGKNYYHELPINGLFNQEYYAKIYPKNKKITVYYSPKNPQISFVDVIPSKTELIAKILLLHFGIYIFTVYSVFKAYELFSP